MKILKRAIIATIITILLLAIIAFIIIIAPNYKKTGNENKTNLVINYTNVTGKMKGEVIIEEDKVYLAKEDIQNYYDDYIYYEPQTNAIIATGNGYYAYFDIDCGTLNLNESVSNSKIIQKNDTYYIPISDLENVYNIKVKNIKKTNTIVIESLNKKLETAKTQKKVNVKYKSTGLSRTLEKLDSNAKVTIVQKKANTSEEDSENSSNQSTKSKLKKQINSIRNKENDDWVKVRTENGTIGYIKKKELSQSVVEREETVPETQTVSLVWDYFSEYGKAPKNDSNVKYKGINVVSPSFFYLQDGELKQNMGQEGINYINWAKSNNYEVWPIVANNNTSEEKVEEFSKLINDYNKRKELIDQIVSCVEDYNLDGINIDFENIKLSDKPALSRFIIELKPRLESRGAKLSVDVTEPDGSERWSLCFDRKLIGNVADYIVFMAYDQYGSYSKTAGSTAAYNWVERNIKKFINQEQVDANKIILGIPFYTRLWKEANGTTTSTVVSMKNINKNIPQDATKEWLESEQQNYVEFNKNNATYKMWIEDEDSIKQKINLIKKYNLSGAAYWQKGYENEEIWNTIEKNLFE